MENGQGTMTDTSLIPPALNDIGIIELLQCDKRPTFILDLERLPDPNNHLLPTVFANTSLNYLHHITSPARLISHLPAHDDELAQFLHFKQWATSSLIHDQQEDGLPPPIHYQTLWWTQSTLRKRWRIISGSAIGLNGTSASLFPSHPTASQNITTTASSDIRPPKKQAKPQEGGHTGWVDQLPASQHTEFFKSTDWSATALGPLDTWSNSLRQITRLVMSDSRAAAVFWYGHRIKRWHPCC